MEIIKVDICILFHFSSFLLFFFSVIYGKTFQAWKYFFPEKKSEVKKHFQKVRWENFTGYKLPFSHAAPFLCNSRDLY